MAHKLIKQIENCTEKYYYNGELYLIVIRDDFESDNCVFFTPDDYSQQFGYLSHSKGHIIKAHIHKFVKREVTYTKEVLFIKKGKIKINIYSEKKDYIDYITVFSGDIVMLCNGGHEFYMLEDSKIIEVKQGPFAGDAIDKERFDGIEEKK